MRRTGSRAVGAALGLLAALLGAAPASAQARLGFIDSSRIFQEYKPAQEAQAQFDRQVQGWRSELAEKEKTVNALRAELRDQGPILSALRRQEKEEGLQRAVSDYERFIQEVWGPQGKAAQENDRATAEIVTQIRSAVEKVAQDKQVDLVFDAAGGAIVWGSRTLDLTNEVLAELATRLQGAH